MQVSLHFVPCDVRLMSIANTSVAHASTDM